MKSGYQVLRQLSPVLVPFPSTSGTMSEKIWRAIWGSKVSQKIKMFMWKLCLNILPVKENLRKKRVDPNGICPICLIEQETMEHTFLLCSWTRPVRFGSQVQSIPDRGNVSNIVVWLEDNISKLQDNPDFTQFGLISIFSILWQIWKSRNSYVFENKIICPFGTLTQANLAISDYNNYQQDNTSSDRMSLRPNLARSGWRPPLEENLKVNVDASSNNQTRCAFSGIIIRNYLGEVLSGLTRKHHTNSALLAEALALRGSMNLASNLQLDKVVFESDCLELVQACRGVYNRGEISTVMQDIFHMKNNFQRCGFTWTARSGNASAHLVAAQASRDLLPANWLLNQPLVVRIQIERDKEFVALRRPNRSHE